MNRVVLTAALTIVFSASAYADQQPAAADGWKKIAQGVFERTNSDGSTERVARGQAGARYDRQRLSQMLDDLKWNKNFYTANPASQDELDQAIASVEVVLHGVETAAVTPAVNSVQSGSMCVGIGYEFDSGLSTSPTNATLTGKSIMRPDDFGPPEPVPTSGTFGVVVTINRHLQSPVTHAVAGNLSNTPTDPYGVKTLTWTINSGSSTPRTRPYPFCESAETQDSLSLAGGECGAGDYRSWDKVYPTCTP